MKIYRSPKAKANILRTYDRLIVWGKLLPWPQAYPPAQTEIR